jgi:hypothetical protein
MRMFPVGITSTAEMLASPSLQSPRSTVFFNLLDGQIEVLCADGRGLFIHVWRRSVFSLRHTLRN